jgi:uncharacterized protein (DUF1499 family)
MRNKIMIFLAVVAALFVLVVILALRTWPLLNAVETGGTPAYPDLQPKTYPLPVDRVFEVSRKVADRMPRWGRVTYRFGPHEIKAVVRSATFGFEDDVTIRVTPQGNGALVWVRSASRIGKWDFGQNARTIRAFFAALDQQLQGEEGRL